jgi:ubiquinone/menaquinone biosynthesis C-methylase UbiE
MTTDMLARARANAEKMKAANVEFRLGQIEALPVENDSVDVVISNCVINLSPDKLQVFREMFRALKPGGRVSVSDIVTNGPMSPEVARDLEAWAGCVSGAMDVSDYRAELEAAGFVDVTATPKPGGDVLGKASSVLAQVGLPFSALITARKPVNGLNRFA